MSTVISLAEARQRILATDAAPQTVTRLVAVCGRIQDIRAYLEVCAPAPCIVVESTQDSQKATATVVHTPLVKLLGAPVATGAVPVVEAEDVTQDEAREAWDKVRSIESHAAPTVRCPLVRGLPAVERREIATAVVDAFGVGDLEVGPHSIILRPDHAVGPLLTAASVWRALRRARLPLPRYIEVEAGEMIAQVTAPIAATSVSEADPDESPTQRERVLRVAGDSGVPTTDVRRAVRALDQIHEALQRLREEIIRRGGGGFDETGYIRALAFGPDEPLNLVALSDYEEIRQSLIDLACEVMPLAPRAQALAALYSDEGVVELAQCFSYASGTRHLEEIESMARHARKRAGIATHRSVLDFRHRTVAPAGGSAQAALDVLGHHGLAETQVRRAARASLDPRGNLNLGTLARWGSWLSTRGTSAEYPVWAPTESTIQDYPEASAA